jgi:uncharacterized protein (TIGR02391 family)
MNTMFEWYLRTARILHLMRRKSADALFALDQDDAADISPIKAYLKTDYDELSREWTARFPQEHLGNLGRHIHFGHKVDFFDILRIDVPELEERAEEHIRSSAREPEALGFENLLHSAVAKASLDAFADGHLREAVLNSITAVFDLIRQRTRLDLDGESLATRVFSVERPLLVLSDVTSISGKNDQVGFMQIFQGAYKGIRNPKAHSLAHDLDRPKAAQYLIFASLLARRVAEATVPAPPSSGAQ